MPDEKMYPACLRRSDAGGHIQTRTAKTVAAYRSRYEGMARTWCRKHREDLVTPLQLATDVAYRAATCRANTLKQYHAAIRQHLRDMWDNSTIPFDQIERIDALLRAQAPTPKIRNRCKKSAKTSADRAKSVRPETLSALTTALWKRPTPIRQIAAAMLEHGCELATRPSEFLAMEEIEIGVFRVPCAKFSESNRRGLEPHRILPTDAYDSFEIEELRRIIGLIAAELAAGATLDRILRRCQRAIREARKALDGNPKIAAYTARHQARANMAAMGMTPDEVAVVLGQASETTAQTHYAPARRGWKCMKGARPPAVNPRLVAKVRPANPTRGWNGPQEQAMSPP